MAIEVRIPTILRTHTGGSKTVEGSGDTLADLFADLETRHAGIQARIVDGEVSEEEVEVVESYLFGHSPTTVVYD